VLGSYHGLFLLGRTAKTMKNLRPVLSSVVAEIDTGHLDQVFMQPFVKIFEFHCCIPVTFFKTCHLLPTERLFSVLYCDWL